MPFAFCLWALAYQTPFAQTLHIGGDVALQRRDDERPFLRGAHESEPVDPRNWRWWELPGGTTPYRWTKADTTVELPGIGAGTWVVAIVAASGRPDGTPAESVWQVGAAPPQALSVAPQRRRYHLIGGATPGGDLRIHLRTTPFVAPGDPRELGFVLHEVRVRPAGAPGPAWPQLGWLTLCLGLIFGGLSLSKATPHAPRPTFFTQSAICDLPSAIAFGSALAAAYVLAFHRTALTVFTPTLALLLAACAVLAGIGVWAIGFFAPDRADGSDRVAVRHTTLQEGSPPPACGGGGQGVRAGGAPQSYALPHRSEGENSVAQTTFLRALLLLTILGFALRLGGMLHPHAMFSDARFNANNLYEVSLGEVLLSAGLPSDAGGGSAPYPPGAYLLLLPAQLLLPEGSPARVLLVQSGVALLDSLLIGALGLLLLRLGFGAPAALLGAACYLLPVSALESFSIGEYANLGGQVIALGFVGLLVMQKAKGKRQNAGQQPPLPTPHAPRPAPPTPHAPRPTPHAPRPTPRAPRPTPHAPRPTPHAPHPAPHAPRPAPRAPRPTPRAPRPAPHALFLIPILTMGLLAHSGVTISLGAFVAAAWGLSWVRRKEGIGPGRLGLVAAAALGVALLIFYSAPAYVEGLLGRAGGGGADAGSPPLEVLGRTALAILGLGPPDLRRVPLPIPLGVAALAGLALIGRADRPGRRGLRLGVGAWWAGLLLSQGLLLVADQGVRWSLFLYPALCLSAGPLLAALWRRGRAGRLVAAAAVALIIAQGLSAWVVQLRDYFHI